MHSIETIINQIYPLSAESKKVLLSKIDEVSLPKSSILLDTFHVEKKIYFIKKGVARAYTISDGDEVTFWFGQEGDCILSMRSYIQNLPSYDIVESLEDCELFAINISDLHELYETNIDLANWGRKLAELELLKTEQRLIQRELGNAIDRYRNLLQVNPTLINRVKLGYIASYLGISQVSLSRIRAEI